MSSAEPWGDIENKAAGVGVFSLALYFTPVLSSHSFLSSASSSSVYMILLLNSLPSPSFPPTPYFSSSSFFFTARRENQVTVPTTSTEDYLVIITPLGSLHLCLTFHDFSFVPSLHTFLPPVCCLHDYKNLEHLEFSQQFTDHYYLSASSVRLGRMVPISQTRTLRLKRFGKLPRITRLINVRGSPPGRIWWLINSTLFLHNIWVEYKLFGARYRVSFCFLSLWLLPNISAE